MTHSALQLFVKEQPHGPLRHHRPRFEHHPPVHLRGELRAARAPPRQGHQHPAELQGNGGVGLARKRRSHDQAGHSPRREDHQRPPCASQPFQLRAHRHLRHCRAAQLHELARGGSGNRGCGGQAHRHPLQRRGSSSGLLGRQPKPEHAMQHAGGYRRRIHRAYPHQERARPCQDQLAARLAFLVRQLREGPAAHEGGIPHDRLFAEGPCQGIEPQPVRIAQALRYRRFHPLGSEGVRRPLQRGQSLRLHPSRALGRAAKPVR